MMPRPSLPMVALLGTLAALGAALAANRTQRPLPPTAGAAAPTPSDPSDVVLAPDVRGVATAPVRSVRLADYLDVAGQIQADPTRVVRVYPPVSGRLVEVRVRPADVVAAGQVLAILASSDVAAAQAAFRQARADAQVKQEALDRARLLYENKVVALRDLQQARADAAIAAATLASADERLALLGADTAASSDQLPVRAPRAGVVTEVGAAPGEYAKSLDNANPLCTIADLVTVWAVGGVYEKDLASVAVGDSADVTTDARPGERWRGRIAAVSSAVDTATRTLQIRVVLPNAGLRLKPNMFATIRVVRDVHPALVVPASAVVREGGSAYVFVRTAPEHFARRSVTLGRDADGGAVEVTSGLTPGDTVVVEGAELLAVASSP